jgi:hypothetical protein
VKIRGFIHFSYSGFGFLVFFSFHFLRCLNLVFDLSVLFHLMGLQFGFGRNELTAGQKNKKLKQIVYQSGA